MKIITQNKKAHFEYFIEQKFVAGIKLQGSEVKSIRAGKCSINEAYITFRNGEVFILNMHIAKFDASSIFNHEETRTRKLLMHKREILKLNNYITAEGFTIIPLKLYFKRNKAKILLGLAKGKKNYDKRQTIKERDIAREMQKEQKEYFR